MSFKVCLRLSTSWKANFSLISFKSKMAQKTLMFRFRGKNLRAFQNRGNSLLKLKLFLETHLNFKNTWMLKQFITINELLPAIISITSWEFPFPLSFGLGGLGFGFGTGGTGLGTKKPWLYWWPPYWAACWAACWAAFWAANWAALSLNPDSKREQRC